MGNIIRKKPIGTQRLKKWEGFRPECTAKDIKNGNKDLGLIGTGLSIATISRIFSSGEATSDNISKMDTFFNQTYFKEMEVPA